MKKYYLHVLFYCLLVCICSCRRKSANPDILPSTEALPPFSFPCIIQSPPEDSVILYRTTRLEPTLLVFGGKFKEGDTIRLDNKGERMNGGIPWDSAIGDLQPFYHDSSLTNQLRIIADTSTSVYYSGWDLGDKLHWYMPVYVVNQSKREKVFIVKDNHAHGIVEAQDKSESNRWYPIGGVPQEYCAVGYMGVRLHPGEFVVLYTLKFGGSDTTALRLGILNGNSLLLSSAFLGSINPGQFVLGRDSTYWLGNTSTEASRYKHFFGAKPKGY